MDPVISQAVQPKKYRLILEPDLTFFTFKGMAEIQLHTNKAITQVYLHSKELSFNEIFLIDGEQNKSKLSCKFELDSKEQNILIKFPISVQDAFFLQIQYEGKINDELMGWYRSKYTQKGELKYIAVTQFEEREARRAFPCLDHPSFKSTFDVEFIIDSKLQGIFNTEIVKEIPLENGKKKIIFAQTPPMVTYIVFFGVGDFEKIEDTSKTPLVRVLGPPDRVQYGHFGLDIGRKSIDFCENYMGIKYPLSKCDHIAIADFAFGAMENWGAITYRENLILVYPGKTSKQLKIRLASVIAHETSHMWFGNLVSPSDWKYLWLNESFASYFTYAVPAHYFPEWDMWSYFMLAESAVGMHRDAFIKSLPIELPGDTEINIDSSVSPIIYHKGSAVLRMFIDFLGEDLYRHGVQFYLQKYENQCASSNQFWDALEEATKKPVHDFAKSWIHQQGYPVLHVSKENDMLQLMQERFCYLPIDEKDSGSGRDSVWLIPISIRWFLSDGSSKVTKYVMNTKILSIPFPPNYIGMKINADQIGVYRVSYSKELLGNLKKNIEDKLLSGLDAYGIESDVAAFVMQGSLSINDYLILCGLLVSKYPDPLLIVDLSANLRLLYLLNSQYSSRVAKLGKQIADQILSQIGFIATESDSMLTAELRNALLWSGYLFGSNIAKQFALDQFSRYLQKQSVPPELLTSILRIGVAEDSKCVPELQNRLLAGDTPEPERHAIIGGLGAMKDKQLILNWMEIALTKISTSNRMLAFGTISANPVIFDFMWDWWQSHHVDLVKALPPSLLDRVYLNVLPLLAQKNGPEILTFLEKAEKEIPALKGTIDMVRELIPIYIGIGSKS